MEKKKNLYRMDDFCLFLSVVLFLLFLFQFRALVPLLAGSDPGLLLEEAAKLALGSPIRMGLILFSALFFQVIGRVIRKKEKISLEVIEALTHRSRVSAANLAVELGREQAVLEKIIRQLARIPGAGVSFDGNFVRIEREEPRPARYAAQAVPAGKSRYESPKKPALEKGKPTPEDLENLPVFLKNLALTAAARKEAAKNPADPQQTLAGSVQTPTGSPQTGGTLKPNPVILIILFFLFWPAAVIYGMSFYLKNVQKKAITRGLNSQ